MEKIMPTPQSNIEVSITKLDANGSIPPTYFAIDTTQKFADYNHAMENLLAQEYQPSWFTKNIMDPLASIGMAWLGEVMTLGYGETSYEGSQIFETNKKSKILELNKNLDFKHSYEQAQLDMKNYLIDNYNLFGGNLKYLQVGNHPDNNVTEITKKVYTTTFYATGGKSIEITVPVKSLKGKDLEVAREKLSAGELVYAEDILKINGSERLANSFKDDFMSPIELSNKLLKKSNAYLAQ